MEVEAIRRIIPAVLPEDEPLIAQKISEWNTSIALPPLVARILASRHLTDEKSVKAFLHPHLDRLHDPFLMPGMREAVETIQDAMDAEIPIMVYGDYDVDGIVSTAVLSDYLKTRGAQVAVYIPKRLEEGYGLNADAIAAIAEGETGLLITVDCGITAASEVTFANELGLRVVITDHHEAAETTPPAEAIINPKAISGYPCDVLCGAGVVAKLIQALGGITALEPYLDLLALATVADLVPLTDENRVLVAMGLKKLNNDPQPGLSALLQVAGLAGKQVGVGQLAFGIAPRLNAGGRLGDAERGYRLLTTDDDDLRISLAAELEADNIQRKKTEDTMLESALLQAAEFSQNWILVLAASGWHHGVAGIVASRVSERTHKPVIILCIDGEQATGSARSIAGIHLYNGLATCRDLFTRFGGHAMAAGLTLPVQNIPALRERLEKWCHEQDSDCWIPALTYDAEPPIDSLDIVTAEQLVMLEPYGFGHKTPKFLLTGAIQAPRSVGSDNSHLQFKLANQSGIALPVIAFRQAYRIPQLQPGVQYHCLVELEVNEYKNRRSISCRLDDLCPQMTAENLRAQLQIADDRGWRALFRAFWQPQHAWHSAKPVSESVMERLLIRALRSSRKGVAIWVHTEQGVERLLTILRRENLCDRADIAIATSEMAYNTIVAAPEAWQLQLSGIHTLLLFDGSPSSFAPFIPGMEDVVKNVAFLQETKPQSSNPIGSASMPLHIDRAQIAAVYRKLHDVADQKYPDYGAFLQKADVPPLMLEATLGILCEIGLAQLYADNGFELQLPKVAGQRRELTESVLYQRLSAND